MYGKGAGVAVVEALDVNDVRDGTTLALVHREGAETGGIETVGEVLHGGEDVHAGFRALLWLFVAE